MCLRNVLAKGRGREDVWPRKGSVGGRGTGSGVQDGRTFHSTSLYVDDTHVSFSIVYCYLYYAVGTLPVLTRRGVLPTCLK